MPEWTHDEIVAFARAAGEYCEWAEGAPDSAISEARRGRRLLVELVRCALDLPDVFSDADTASVGNEEYRRVYKRFGALPFNYYSECFDPLIVPGEEIVTADLADDLADIWRDVKNGLLLWYEEETNAAACHWRFHFETHWGHHATSAIYALQCWFAQHVEDTEDCSGRS